MSTRVGLAAAGGGGGAGLLMLLVAVSPWRPGGLLVALAVAVVAAPLATAAGVAGMLRLAAQPGVRDAARVAALGMPWLLLLWLFALLASGVTDAGVQQGAAVVLSGASAAALAARFAGVAAEPEA